MNLLLLKRIFAFFLVAVLFCNFYSCLGSDQKEGGGPLETGETLQLPTETLPEEEDDTDPVGDGDGQSPAEQTEHVHQYVKTVNAPTCGAGGYTLHKCICGASYRDASTPATHEHSFAFNSQTGDSINRYVCSVCKIFAEDVGKWYYPNHNRTTATYYLKSDGFGGGYFYVGGTGSIPDYTYVPEDGAFPAWMGYLGYNRLIIGNGITVIGASAFMQMSDVELDSIVIGSSVREIKGMAFYETSFDKMYLPLSLKKVGQNAIVIPMGTDIYYEGTAEDMKKISCEGFDNLYVYLEEFCDAVVHYETPLPTP